MNRVSFSHIISIGLAIFSMLFGSGNLMYPIYVGMTSGSYAWAGLPGFLITAVCLPIMGLIAMVLFDGDYTSFFCRLGTIPGRLLITLCMLIIGPCIAIPRIVTLSHTMIAPFIPLSLLQDPHNMLASFIFSILFLGITFLATYRENKIVEILGNVISPLLLFSLAVIVLKGILLAVSPTTPISTTAHALFKNGFLTGYRTLDLLGGLFFASIVMNILKNTLPPQIAHNPRRLALISAKSGLIGTCLLGLVYVGMGFLGAFHGHGLLHVNEGELFRAITFSILGNHGALLIATAVLMACLSTSVALSAVVADYVQKTLCKDYIDYITSLIIVLLASVPLSTIGLDTILHLTAGPITYIGYPVIIMLTACNIAYKLSNFKPVKMPVLLTFITMVILYCI